MQQYATMIHWWIVMTIIGTLWIVIVIVIYILDSITILIKCWLLWTYYYHILVILDIMFYPYGTKKNMISMTPLGSRGNPWRLRWLQPLRVTAAIAQGFLRLAEGLGLGCDDWHWTKNKWWLKQQTMGIDIYIYTYYVIYNVNPGLINP
jgi:hypothetical protein